MWDSHQKRINYNQLQVILWPLIMDKNLHRKGRPITPEIVHLEGQFSNCLLLDKKRNNKLNGLLIIFFQNFANLNVLNGRKLETKMDKCAILRFLSDFYLMGIFITRKK